MIFASLTFLLVFIPLLIAVYFVIPAKYNKARKYVLLLFSLFFYASGEPIYILLLLGCVLLTWLLSRRIEEKKCFCMIFAVIINLLPLIYFKYAGFIVENVATLTNTTIFHLPNTALPIGISFYTFQMIGYVIDLYRERILRQKNIAFLLLYILFFPQLIAGPIVRYKDVEDAIENNRVSWEKIKYGTGRFVIGLSKKVLIANQVGYIATEIMSHPLYSISTSLLWIAVIAFTLQIYFDFSGYSDMAIGLGSIFGFSFPENFKKPYMSTSITEFWRRWHITLGSFFRDYVYIPLGGNRVNIVRWVFNVSIVWVLTGLWHGAAWNFVIWGVYYAVLLVMEKGFDKVTVLFNWRVPMWIKWTLTMFFVTLGWAIFMADGYSVNELSTFISRLFRSAPLENKVTIASMNLFGYLPYMVLGVLISCPTGSIFERFMKRINQIENKALFVLHDIVILAMLVLCIIYLVGGSYNPFIYYRF